eukprot:scaffold51195_cov35-Phaeocystis_antarctica.AAC.2
MLRRRRRSRPRRRHPAAAPVRHRPSVRPGWKVRASSGAIVGARARVRASNEPGLGRGLGRGLGLLANLSVHRRGLLLVTRL